MTTISFIIPTLNSAATLDACLTAIRAQNLPPRTTLEIIIADAGSTDATLHIARQHHADKIIPNPLKTGEAGKSAGIHASRGDLIALVDSDNILPDQTWLTAMAAPFADPRIIAAEPIAYTPRPRDPPLTRYFALLGMNDPLCLFVGNYDRHCAITGKWTGLPLPTQDCGGYLSFTPDPSAMPTIGANGFILRRTALPHVQWSPYFFDIDVAQQIAAARLGRFAKVKCGIIHLYCARLSQFARKQDRRVRDFLFFSSPHCTARRTYAWKQTGLHPGVLRFTVATLLLLPLLLQQWRGNRRSPDPAWWYHVPVCWITLWTYGRGVLLQRLGLLNAPASRRNWQK